MKPVKSAENVKLSSADSGSIAESKDVDDHGFLGFRLPERDL